MIWFFRIWVLVLAGIYVYGFISLRREFGKPEWLFLGAAGVVLVIGAPVWWLS